MNKKQILETLWCGALGDAIGNPLEFKTIVSKKDFNASAADALRISDDTQMSLFIYESLLKSEPTTQLALLRWYRTQTQKAPAKLPKGAKVDLLDYAVLYRSEAPGGTCMGSCRKLAVCLPVVNDSKGNGTVMRAAAFAVHGYLNSWDPTRVYLQAQDDALLTHKHPYAWQSSVTLCAVLLRLFDGKGLMESTYEAVAMIDPEFGKLILSMFDLKAFKELRSRRSGWVAEEALALAIGSAYWSHNADDPLMDALWLAVSGVSTDSDTVASITGNLCGAMGQAAPDSAYAKMTARPALLHIDDQYLK